MSDAGAQSALRPSRSGQTDVRRALRELEDALNGVERAAAGALGAGTDEERRRKTRTAIQSARVTVDMLGEALLDRVCASTGAERDCLNPGNLVVGVTAHCACGRTFTDNVRCGFAELGPGATAPAGDADVFEA